MRCVKRSPNDTDAALLARGGLRQCGALLLLTVHAGCTEPPPLPPRVTVDVLDADVADVLEASVPMDVVDADVADMEAAAPDADALVESITLPAPRPVGPISGAVVTSRRPTLRWQLSAGISGGRVDICSDSNCSTVIQTVETREGASAVPTSDLPERTVVFWRVHGVAAGAYSRATGPVWQLTVPAMPAARPAVDTTSRLGLHDINGDGYADTVVGAGGQGRVFVYYGAASGVAGTPTTTLVNPVATDRWYGYAVALGDLNGDGYADLAVGGESAIEPATYVYTYYGGPQGLPSAPSRRIMNPSPADQRGIFAADVHIADLSSDGIADLIVTEPGGGPHLTPTPCDSGAVGNPGPGLVHVFNGTRAGVSDTASLTLTSTQRGCYSSATRVAAGDVNGDGRLDLLVCNKRTGGYAYLRGGFEVFMNGQKGLAATPAVSVHGTRDHGGLGIGAAALGDIDGDGYGDFAVGEPGYDSRWSYNLAYVLPGSANGVPSALPMPITGMAGSAFGYSIAGLGDVNGDGVADFGVGAGDTNGGRGAAHIYLGSTAGPAAGPTVVLPSPEGGNFGAVLGANDLNGDGRTDIEVSGAGRVYVFSGAPSLATTPGRQLTNPGADTFGSSID